MTRAEQAGTSTAVEAPDDAVVVWQVACCGKVLYEGQNGELARSLYDHHREKPIVFPDHRPVLYRGVIEWEVVDA